MHNYTIEKNDPLPSESLAYPQYECNILNSWYFSIFYYLISMYQYHRLTIRVTINCPFTTKQCLLSSYLHCSFSITGSLHRTTSVPEYVYKLGMTESDFVSRPSYGGTYYQSDRVRKMKGKKQKWLATVISEASHKSKYFILKNWGKWGEKQK